MTRTALMVLALAIAAGCAEPVITPVNSPAEVEPSAAAPADAIRRITLTRGDSLGVGVDTEGNVTITATIAEGKPDAGTYTSEDETMYDTAMAAKNALGDANTEVSFDVGADGQIVTIVYAVTLGAAK